MSYYHPPSDEAVADFDTVCWALCKGPEEDLYACARNTVMAFAPFKTDRWPHFEAALAIVVTTAEPWDAVMQAAAILRGIR